MGTAPTTHSEMVGLGFGDDGELGHAMHLLLDVAIPPPPRFRQPRMEQEYLRFVGDRLRRWLEETPPSIGVTPIQPAIVVERDGTVSGYILLAESHIAAHLDYRALVGYLDIFSCRPFDPEAVTQDIMRELKVGIVATHVLDRGLEYLTQGLAQGPS